MTLIGEYENDPTVTDKKYVDNPTKTYQTKSALLLSSELTKWMRHRAEQLKHIKDKQE